MIWDLLGHFNGFTFGLIVIACALAYIRSQVRQAAGEGSCNRVECIAQEWHRSMRMHWIDDHPGEPPPPTWEGLPADVRESFRALVFESEEQARNL